MKVTQKITIVVMGLFIATSAVLADINISSLDSVKRELKQNPNRDEVYSAYIKSSNLERKGQKFTSLKDKQENEKRIEITKVLKKWLDAHK